MCHRWQYCSQKDFFKKIQWLLRVPVLPSVIGGKGNNLLRSLSTLQNPCNSALQNSSKWAPYSLLMIQCFRFHKCKEKISEHCIFGEKLEWCIEKSASLWNSESVWKSLLIKAGITYEKMFRIAISMQAVCNYCGYSVEWQLGVEAHINKLAITYIQRITKWTMFFCGRDSFKGKSAENEIKGDLFREAVTQEKQIICEN